MDDHDGVFPLINEPINHPDIDGRRMLGRYPGSKNGFIAASHDRAFLDTYVDHVTSINCDDVRTVQELPHYSSIRISFAFTSASTRLDAPSLSKRFEAWVLIVLTER